jgi:L-ribulose-5-phosphate 3-epimerase
MENSRRDFLKYSSGLMLPSIQTHEQIVENKPITIKPKIKLSISSYSYWHFKKEKYSLFKVIDEAAKLGVEGVDILHRQMESEENSYIQNLKRHAFENGIALTCLSIHQGFVFADKAEWQKNIDHTIKCIELAAKMGIPCMRLNTGRWNTIKSFDDLMKARGIEPILPGYTEDDGFKWCIEGIEKCLPAAEQNGVLLALENHWGLGSTPEGMLRIKKAIDSPWLGLLMDTGNFLENPYDKLEMIAPQTKFVQAKTYYGGGEWYSLDLDYPRIVKILQKVNYQGYISIEFEGKEAGEIGAKKSVELLRKALNS